MKYLLEERSTMLFSRHILRVSRLVAFRTDRLNGILTAKGIARSFLQHQTGISSDQMGRILSGERKPGDDKITKIVIALEVDADYLLETDVRYDSMLPLRAAASMSLERYLTARSLTDEAVLPDDAEMLQQMARELPEPPVWMKEWEKHHASAVLSLKMRPAPKPPEPQRSSRRGSRRLPS